MKREISNSATNEVTIERYLHLTKEYFPVNMDSAHEQINCAIDLIVGIQNKKMLADAYYYKGYMYVIQQKFDQSIKFYLAARSIYQEQSDYLLADELCENVMDIADQHGLLQLAVYYGEERIKYIDEIEDYKKKADIYYSLGLIYSHHGSFILANKNLLKAKYIMDRNGGLEDAPFFSDLYNNLGIVQYGLSGLLEESIYLDSALYYYNRAIRMGPEPWIKAKVLTNIGNVHLKRGDWLLAENTLKEALSLQDSLGAKRLTIATRNNLGILFYQQGIYDTATFYFQSSIHENLATRSTVENERDNEKHIRFINDEELGQSLVYFDSLRSIHKVHVDQQIPVTYLKEQLVVAKNLKVVMATHIQTENLLANKRDEVRKEQQAKEERLIYLVVVGILLATIIVLLLIYSREKLKSRGVRKYLIDKYDS
ncbi:MAG: tetratricopeptide repeat protein [Cyclobacteriaceae bacterium]